MGLLEFTRATSVNINSRSNFSQFIENDNSELFIKTITTTNFGVLFPYPNHPSSCRIDFLSFLDSPAS